MFGFIRKMTKRPIIYLSLNDRQCQARPTLVNISFDKTLFYPFIVSERYYTMMINMLEYVFQIK